MFSSFSQSFQSPAKGHGIVKKLDVGFLGNFFFYFIAKSGLLPVGFGTVAQDIL